MPLKAQLKNLAERARRLNARSRTFVRDAKAATAVEFAMIAVPFFMLFCAIFESAFLAFNQGNLEAATYAISRYMLTGQAQGASWTASTFRTNFCDKTITGILGVFDCTNTSKMFFDVRSATDFTTNPAAGQNLFTGTNSFSMGAVGDVVVLRVGYVYPLYFTGIFNSWGSSGSTTKNIQAAAILKTEN